MLIHNFESLKQTPIEHAFIDKVAYFLLQLSFSIYTNISLHS